MNKTWKKYSLSDIKKNLYNSQDISSTNS